MGFFRQEFWNGLLFPPPEDFSDPGIESTSLEFPALQAYPVGEGGPQEVGTQNKADTVRNAALWELKPPVSGAQYELDAC